MSMMCGYDPDQSLEIEEMTQAFQDISFQKDEALTHKDLTLSSYKVLKIKYNKMQELVEEDQRTKNLHEETINKLQKEIVATKEKIRQHADREVKLEKEIDNLNKNLKDKDKNSNKILLNAIDKKFKTFEDLLRQEFEDRNKDIEVKLDQVAEKTYAEALNSRDTPTERGENECVNSSAGRMEQRKRMHVRNQEISEEKERKFRSCNLVIHGVAESSIQHEKKADYEFVENLLQTVGSSASIKEVIRLGKKNQDKRRPVKVILNCEAARNEVLGNLSWLKDNDQFKGISITEEDYTLCERDLIKDFIKQAKAQNEQLPHDSPYEFKVRGTPKNGLRLKEVRKKTYPIRQTLQQ